MSTRPRNTRAASEPLAGQQQDAATVSVITETASAPAGDLPPAGINTPANESSGDAAGAAPADPVKTQDSASQTDAIVAEAVTGALTPKVEASAFGTLVGTQPLENLGETFRERLQRGPRCLQEVRYRGKSYQPGEHLPGDIEDDDEDELDALGAI